MTTTLRTTRALLDRDLVSPDDARAIDAVTRRYAVAIPPALAELIDPADATDPIAMQFVPQASELVVTPEEAADPIGDHAHSPVEGIVHRYPDRVLLKLVNVCEVYCRFCFRREMVGPGQPAMLSPAVLDAALDYIRARPEIWEVILTGGDPLVLSARRLRAVMRTIAEIAHVKVIRIHTRLPVAAPDKITAELVRALKLKGKAVYVGLHVNHARELTYAARAACARLVDAGIPMVSQTVLIAGVNDDHAALADLMRALVECRIKPYYLHHGDLAPGTSHLRTSIARGQELMRGLRGHLSGLCQPEYVLDIPGGHGKSPVGPVYATARGAEPAERGRAAKDLSATDYMATGYVVTDYNGGRHDYPPREIAAARRVSGAAPTGRRQTPPTRG